MQTNESVQKSSYFASRNIDPAFYETYTIPNYLLNVLPADKNASILDIGCGLGQFLHELKKRGYNNTLGIDINDESLEECKRKNLNSQRIQDIISFGKETNQKFDFITMSHVLEHIDKSQIIDTLKAIKDFLLKDGGAFIVMVPNAQSNTGAYWMYEDFTHSTLFTAGSLFYVLRSAGFHEIDFLNPNGTDFLPFHKKIIVKTFLAWYRIRQDFWNRITQSSFHRPSPRIYSFELKALAR